MSSAQPVLKIPIITDRNLSWSEFVVGGPDGELPFPVGLLAHPQSVVCLRFSGQFPWFTEDSPAVIVDRTADDPEELVKKLVVVFFERLPFQLRPSGRDYDIEASATEWMRNFLKDKSRTPPDKPGLLAGQLDLQLIDEFHSSPGDSKLWRVVLRTGNTHFIPRSSEIPLSDWQTSGSKSETRAMLGSILRREVRIYGKVLSWISPELLDRSLHR